jgi:hypothetical protein
LDLVKARSAGEMEADGHPVLRCAGQWLAAVRRVLRLHGTEIA